MSQAASHRDGAAGIDLTNVMDQEVTKTLPVDAKSKLLESIYSPIKSELADVERLLISELKSEVPAVEELLEHSRLLGGKRMRPVLLLLSGGSCGDLSSAHVAMATALEMIHLATLIHDDVIDESATRRNQPTAHSKWGNKTSVLLGDYLFTHSFSVASKTNSIDAVKLLAEASNLVCEGEMKQNLWQANFEISEAEYLQMISQKTGELCSVACSAGAVLSGVDEVMVSRYGKFGRDLGMAFQVIDDVLDLVGDPSKVGKTLGTDLTNQKPTLPVIHALSVLGGSEHSNLLELLGNKGAIDRDSIMKVLEGTGSIDYARQKAASLAKDAVGFANTLGSDNQMADGLGHVGKFILSRTF